MEAVIDSPLAQSSSPQIEDPYAQALSDIAVGLHGLDAAFTELDNLREQEQELSDACQAAAVEERAVLENGDTSEKQSVERLLKARALKDVRGARLEAMRKRIASHINLVTEELGVDLRRRFALLGHQMLSDKQSKISAVCNDWWPSGTAVGVPVEALVRASQPYIKTMQVSNFVSNQSLSDPQAELEALRTLPSRWLEALHRLIAGQDPFER